MASTIKPSGISDRIAFGFTKALRWTADTFFAERYGHRAVVLETVAAVPGMVGATINHLACLRRMCDDKGWIKTLMDEAENERMHLMTFIEVSKPTMFERAVIIGVQWVFYLFFFALYLVSSKTAHRVVGYFEEEAVISYTHYLAEIDEGRSENVPAPEIAKRYWGLPDDATLRDVVLGGPCRRSPSPRCKPRLCERTRRSAGREHRANARRMSRSSRTGRRPPDSAAWHEGGRIMVETCTIQLLVEDPSVLASLQFSLSIEGFRRRRSCALEAFIIDERYGGDGVKDPRGNASARKQRSWRSSSRPILTAGYVTALPIAMPSSSRSP